jgi:nucleoside-diphosphate-sugar epimerase
MAEKPSVLVTGVSGNLGLRLLQQLQGFNVIGADLRQPETSAELTLFENVDLREERSCSQMLGLFRRFRPVAVVHLAFDARPYTPVAEERTKMWQTNVAGTGRVIEAVAEHNRMLGGIEKFIYPSSAWLYGTGMDKPVAEDSPLRTQALACTADKLEAEQTLRMRTKSMGHCKTYILRSHTFAGAPAGSFLIDLLRGAPRGAGFLGQRRRKQGKRLPLLLPSGGNYLEQRFQFVHIDDVARLIAYIVRRPLHDLPLNIMNLAGRSEPLSLRTCIHEAQLKVVRIPGPALCRWAQNMLCSLGVSDVSPEAMLYAQGSLTLDTTRLRIFLGEDYRKIIQYTCEQALKDSFV